MTDTTSLMKLPTEPVTLPIDTEDELVKKLRVFIEDSLTKMHSFLVEHPDDLDWVMVMDDSGLVPPDRREPGLFERIFRGSA